MTLNFFTIFLLYRQAVNPNRYLDIPSIVFGILMQRKTALLFQMHPTAPRVLSAAKLGIQYFP